MPKPKIKPYKGKLDTKMDEMMAQTTLTDTKLESLSVEIKKKNVH